MTYSSASGSMAGGGTDVGRVLFFFLLLDGIPYFMAAGFYNQALRCGSNEQS